MTDNETILFVKAVYPNAIAMNVANGYVIIKISNEPIDYILANYEKYQISSNATTINQAWISVANIINRQLIEKWER